MRLDHPMLSINPSGSRILARLVRAGLVRRRPLVQILEPARSPDLLALHLPSVPFAVSVDQKVEG